MGPLAGRRILVTRQPEQAADLSAGLVALGATVVEVPLVELAPPGDPGPLRRALAGLGSYRWIALTSANAARRLADALRDAGRTLPPSVSVASVGPATSEAVRKALGVEPALEPESDYRAEGLLRAFEAHDLTGHSVLLPLSERARETLAEGLRARGARVDAVVAYRTLTPPGARERLEAALAEGVDLVTLASPSAVEGLLAALGQRARGLPCAVIGPVTERSARAAGLEVEAAAEPSTAQGLLAAIRRRYERS